MDNIAHIIKKCIKGNEASCKKLYEQFLPYAFGICKRYGVPENDLKDQVQIIFSSTFKSLQNFDASKASFKTWFTQICINKIIDQRRKSNGNIFNKELSEMDGLLVGDDTDLIHDKLDRTYILKILSKMPQQFQCVFNMFIMDGYTHKEIAEKLNISEGSSRVILKRARSWSQEALARLLNTVDYE